MCTCHHGDHRLVPMFGVMVCATPGCHCVYAYVDKRMGVRDDVRPR